MTTGCGTTFRLTTTDLRVCDERAKWLVRAPTRGRPPVASVTPSCAVPLSACYVSGSGNGSPVCLSKLTPVMDRRSNTHPYALPVGCRAVMFLLSTMSET